MHVWETQAIMSMAGKKVTVPKLHAKETIRRHVPCNDQVNVLWLYPLPGSYTNLVCQITVQPGYLGYLLKT